MNTKIGEVTVEVKAGLSVSDDTFEACLGLIRIHAKNNGLNGLLIKIPDDDIDHCGVIPICTKEQLDGAVDGLYTAKFCDKKEDNDD